MDYAVTEKDEYINRTRKTDPARWNNFLIIIIIIVFTAVPNPTQLKCSLPLERQK